MAKAREDAFGRGSIASVLAGARAVVGDGGGRARVREGGFASLKNPTRPFTPADHSRGLANSYVALMPCTCNKHAHGSRTRVSLMCGRLIGNQDVGPPPSTPNFGSIGSGLLLTKPATTFKRTPLEKTLSSENTAPTPCEGKPLQRAPYVHVSDSLSDAGDAAWRLVQPAVSALDEHTAPMEQALDGLTVALEDKAAQALTRVHKQAIIATLELIIEDSQPPVWMNGGREGGMTGWIVVYRLC